MSLTDHGPVRKQQVHDRLGILHHRHLHRKLKERFPAAFNTRWTRRHWLHASLFATLGALLATIVPGFSSQLQPAAQLHATLPLQLPPLTVRAPGEGSGRFWDVVQVERGQTLGGVFDRMGVPAATMRPMAPSGPVRWSCPTISASVRGRRRSASGGSSSTAT